MLYIILTDKRRENYMKRSVAHGKAGLVHRARCSSNESLNAQGGPLVRMRPRRQVDGKSSRVALASVAIRSACRAESRKNYLSQNKRGH